LDVCFEGAVKSAMRERADEMHAPIIGYKQALPE